MELRGRAAQGNHSLRPKEERQPPGGLEGRAILRLSFLKEGRTESVDEQDRQMARATEWSPEGKRKGRLGRKTRLGHVGPPRPW
jgi:hypothetical protein